MHREEMERLTTCVDCGSEVSGSLDRAYAFGPRGLLCRACAIRRGGSYDEGQDRWVRDPDVSDLPDPRRPHP